MKASSQTAGWKGMLIKHGEKGILGIIAAVVCWMMFSGLQQEGLKPDKTPAKLADRVSNAEQYIIQEPRFKLVNGGEKFRPGQYDSILKNGLEKISFEDKPFNFDTEEFPKIAKRTQPTVFPAEEVHVTALVVQVALADEETVKKQQAILQNLNDKKALAELKKKELEQKKLEEKEKRERLRQAAQQNATRGESRQPRDNPLTAQPIIGAPEQITEIRQPHPAIQNLTGVTTATRPIAVVTALIPYRKQIQEYRQTLVDGKDIIPGRLPEDDSPKIANFVVERARVVNPNEPDDKLEWVDISRDAQNFFMQYSKQLTPSEDPVVPSLIGPVTTGIAKKNIPRWYTVSPLPTLADRKWQREVTHPRIPLFADLTDDEIKQEAANVFVPPPAAGGFGQPVMPVEPVEVELPEYVLLRHIDFNVAPGTNYRYRVTLVYQNPNLGLDNKYLSGEVSPAEELATAPSVPSESVTLPPLFQILAGGDVSYPSARRFDDVPRTSIWEWVINIDPKLGGEVAKNFPGIAVGDLLDLTGTTKILNRPAGQAVETPDFSFADHRIPRGAQMPYLVDVFGKQAPPAPKLPKQVPGYDGTIPPPVAEPKREQPYSEILYVDQDGKLHSSSSTYADTLIDNYKLRYESTDASLSNGPDTMQPEMRRGSVNPLFDTDR